MTEVSCASVFGVHESVEAVAYDPSHARLAATSHFGKVKLFTVERNGENVPINRYSENE